LVQMCLRLLRAQIWSTGAEAHLSRCSALAVPSSVLDRPALVAYARLLALGGTHQKLHEELLTAGLAFDGADADRLDEGTIARAVRAASAEGVPEGAIQELHGRWTELQRRLDTELELRRRNRNRALAGDLQKRCAKEQAEIAQVLNALKATLEIALKDPEQLSFDFDASLRDLHEAALRRRVAAIPDEIEQEQAQIARRYADPTVRLFPVAVTLLVPVKD
jgi:hypothetical protein